MAKAKKKETTTSGFLKKRTIKRPNRHSKKRSSKIKTSKHYKKAYKGQGR